jgi:hypothetical protein
MNREAMATDARERRWETALFALLLAAHLAPVWAFTVFPSQDGPAHLENANVIRRYDEPAGALFRQHYSLRGKLEPNWAGHLLLVGLMHLAEPRTAEKLLVSLCVLALPLAARYAMSAARPAAPWPAIFVVPFTLSWFVHMGFYYFTLSLALFFVAVGYWLRHQDRLRAREVATLAALGLALHFAHLVSLIAAVVVTTLLAACRRSSTLVVKTIAAFLPAVCLTGLFFLARPWQSYPPAPPSQQLEKLSRLDPVLVSFGDAETLPSSALFWALAAAAAAIIVRKLIRRSIGPHDGLLLAVAAMTALYVYAPQAAANGGYVSPRLAVYPVFLLLIWCAAEGAPRLVRVAGQAAGAGVALLLLLVRVPIYRDIDRAYGEYLAAAALVEPDTILLSLRQGEPRARGEARSDRVDVFLHAGGHIAAEKNVIQLVNYEARTGHFPTQFRSDPYVQMGDPERNPPCVNLATYRQRSGRAIDYVLLWQFPDAAGDPCIRLLLQQLGSDYERVFTSETGRARLYRVRSP